MKLKVLILTLIGSFFLQEDVSYGENFEDVEIRVWCDPDTLTRPGVFELGAELTTVMNETFIYTFMATGLAAFHFSESFAIEGSFSYGTSLNKEDKRILFDEFEIKTQIFRTQYNAEIAAQWQLSSGRLIYFDTYLQAGVGNTGINWQYDDFCDPPDFTTNPDAEASTDKHRKILSRNYAGAGQRYFVSKNRPIN